MSIKKPNSVLLMVKNQN